MSYDIKFVIANNGQRLGDNLLFIYYYSQHA